MKKNYPFRVYEICTLLLTLMLCSMSLTAKTVPAFTGNDPASILKKEAANGGKQLSFIENKGQITDQNYKQRHDIQFSLRASNGLNIFVGNGEIHYQFNKKEAPPGLPQGEEMLPDGEKLTIDKRLPHNTSLSFGEGRGEASYTMYRMDVELVGANKNAKVITEQEQEYYENYYTSATADGEKGAVAHSYNKITYKDVYPNIDWVLYTSGGKLKHQFVVRQGGRVSDIKLKYGGATKLELNRDGNLVANTPQGAITEDAPYTYQRDGKNISSRFVLAGNILSYETGNYTGDLIIDPGLVWATYYGGPGDDEGYSVTTDGSGNVYMAGLTNSLSGIATAGAYQTTIGGGYDAFLVQFNSTGARQWATYYGGTGDDYGLSVATDGSNVYMSGNTLSTSGIATAGAYQTTLNAGTWDAFLVQFNSAGVRQWATYYGGPGIDAGNSVATDGSGNVYLAGNTGSFSDISTAGVYQTSYNGNTDAFLVQFNSAGVRQWATYYGGSGADYGNSVATDGSGNVYMGGYTSSTSVIAAAGAYQTTFGGGTYDAFLVQFNSAGVRQWATYYGGTGDDRGMSVATDGTGNVYLASQTTSTTGIATAGAYQTTFGWGLWDAFLVQFNNAGVRQWATYYGGTGDDRGASVATDASGNVYMAGLTTSTSGIATAGAYQTINGGSDDAFIVQFNSAGVRQVATYYGGTGSDIGNSVATNGSGKVYIAGYTASTSGIATAGTYQTTYGGGTWDAFLAQFQFIPPITGTTTVCPGATTSLSDATAGGVWSTPNTTVATVGASGIVTGVSGGTAVISYTVSGGTETATVIVTNGLPVITSVNPLMGYPASAVTITGTGFNTTAANNIVFFGATQAVVNAASATSLSVSVPTGATYQDVTVNNTGCALTGFSQYPFLPTYDNSPYIPGVVNLDPKVDFTSGNDSWDVAIGDIDGDGKPDLVVTIQSSSTVSVYRNTSVSGSITAGSFAPRVNFATGLNPIGIVIGDIDGDGKPEIVVANSADNTVSVFRNTSTAGSISFATKVDLVTGSSPMYIAIGDIDEDGKVDLAVSNMGSNTISILRNISAPGTMNFDAKVDFTAGLGPEGIAMDDIDGDGKTDLVVTNYNTISVSVFRNTSVIGSVNFAPKVDFITGSGPRDIAIGDIDGDGKPDLAVANQNSNTFSILRNTSVSGSVSFAAKVDFTTNTSPQGIAMGDIDGDGKADIAVTNYGSNRVSVCRNTSTSGSVNFAPNIYFITGFYPIGIAIGDIDGDGKPDLAIANRTSNTVSVLHNDPLSPITGVTIVCQGATTTLSESAINGVWSTPNTTVATIDAGGVVTGVSGGTAVISYSVIGGTATTTVTVTGKPTISSVSPFIGYPASAVTITGTGFNTTTGNNIVYFGATRATVTLASATSLSVTVPTGATYQDVTVDNTGCALTGFSLFQFLPTYNNSAYIPGMVNLDPNIDFTAGTNPYYVAIADIDGDGKADLLVTNYSSNTVSVYRNTSVSGSITAGSFAAKVDFTTGSGPIGIAIGDIDGDGKPDLAIANQNSSTVSVLRNTSVSGSVSFATKVDFTTGLGPQLIAISDIDGDGKADLAVANASSNTVSVLRNTSISGSVNFAAKVDFTTGTNPSGIAINDVDGDGKPDLAVANSVSNTVSVFRNTSAIGSVNFAAKVDFTAGSNPYNVVIGDMDGDGKADLAVANASSSTVSVFRNTSVSGSVSFAAKVDFTASAVPWDIAIGDIDGDGKADLAVACRGSNTVSVFRNTSTVGSVNFAAKVDFTTGALPQGIAIGDIDGDGKPDVATANWTAVSVSVLHNDPLSPISGTTTINMCSGGTTTLSDMATNGVWSTPNTTVATVSATGVVFGVSGGTAVISYTVIGGTATVTVTVSPPSPAPIAGASTVCVGFTITLSDPTASGTWSSSNSAVATINSAGFVVNSAAQGTTTISYSTGCGSPATHVITVNAVPVPIAGTPVTLCVSGGTTTTTLSDGSTGGTWSSSNSAVATINSTGFVVTSASQGTTIISYDNGCSPAATITVTVNATPAPIAGNAQMCTGGSTITLSDASTNGTWSGGTAGIATINGITRVLTPGATQGTTTITYSNVCGSATITATVNATPVAIAGNAQMCTGSTITLSDASANGTWSSSNTVVATINSGGFVLTSISPGTTTISYSNGCGSAATITATVSATPAGAITGNSQMCTGGPTITLSDPVTGGTWGGGTAGIAVVNSSTGVVTPGATQGTTTITYTNGCGTATITATVNATPAIIGGNSLMCASSSTITLTNTSTNGTWSGGTVGIATVNSSTGLVTPGATQGTTTISYSNGCGSATTITATVNGSPAAIMGSPTTLCVSSGSPTTTLSDATTGGVWSSSNTSVATVSLTGVVTRSAAGTTTITYSNGCGTDATTTVTVQSVPSPPGPITGMALVCATNTTALSNATPGGVWSSNNTSVAVINAGGVVTGLALGTATISYTISNSCGNAFATTIVTIDTLSPPAPISGSYATPFCVGSTIPLSDITPGGAWSSANTSIATVNNAGVVTGVSHGSCIIYYAVTGGCGRIATGEIVTIDTILYPGTITGIDSVCPGNTIVLSDNIAGGIWSSNSLSIATVNSAGVVYGNAAGIDTIRYSFTNSCGTFAAKHFIDVRVTTSIACGGNPSNVNAVGAMFAALKVFPNPNDGTFNIEMLSDINEPVQVIITNVVGEKVKEFVTNTNQSMVVRLDATGIYFVSAITNEGMYNAKVVISAK